MTTETSTSIESKSGQKDGWLGKLMGNAARTLIAKYRSGETVMGRTYGAHWGVASGVAEEMEKGRSFVGAVWAVFDAHPRSVETVRLSTLLVLGGLLELLYREFPTLQRSGVALGLLATIVFASHGEEETYVNSPPKEPDKDEPICPRCGGSMREKSGGWGNELCYRCQGTGKLSRTPYNDMLKKRTLW